MAFSDEEVGGSFLVVAVPQQIVPFAFKIPSKQIGTLGNHFAAINFN